VNAHGLVRRYSGSSAWVTLATVRACALAVLVGNLATVAGCAMLAPGSRANASGKLYGPGGTAGDFALTWQAPRTAGDLLYEALRLLVLGVALTAVVVTAVWWAHRKGKRSNGGAAHAHHQ
jgi:hypothetical protein